MKTRINQSNYWLTLLLLMTTLGAFAQQPAIQYFRPYDQRGVNVYETPKTDTVVFDGLKLRLGANFTQGWQNITHSTCDSYRSRQLV